MGKKTALYLRLSKDDGNEYESNSISHQREILHRYARDHEFNDLIEYVDDGFSGITFNRPGFLQMLQDINSDTINEILVKDLSRFGRNNTMVVYYIDIIFSEFNVRLISVTDNLDTATHGIDDLIIPIRSIMNETYSKEMSRKSRAAHVHRALKGEWCGGKAPIGYMKSPTAKNKLIPDPNTASTVQEMFRMAAGMYSIKYVALFFRMHASVIIRLLSNPLYAGHTISRRSATVSMKVKAKVPESEWITMMNTHEALVSQEDFDKVQVKLKRRREILDKKRIIPIPLYKNLLICGLCSQPLSTGKQGKYMCRKCNGQVTTETKLNSIIKSELVKAKEYTETLPAILIQLKNDESTLRLKVKKAMESNVKGELTDKALDDLLHESKRQRDELDETIKLHETDLTHARRIIRGGIPDSLTRDNILKLVEKITIHGNGSVDIKYKRRELV